MSSLSNSGTLGDIDKRFLQLDVWVKIDCSLYSIVRNAFEWY